MATSATFPIKPLPGIIIVEVIQEKEIAGFKITNQTEARIISGKVLAVGKDWLHQSGKLVSGDVNVGDTIHYRLVYGNDSVEVNGQKLRYITFNEVLGVLDE